MKVYIFGQTVSGLIALKPTFFYVVVVIAVILVSVAVYEKKVEEKALKV